MSDLRHTKYSNLTELKLAKYILHHTGFAVTLTFGHMKCSCHKTIVVIAGRRQIIFIKVYKCCER